MVENNENYFDAKKDLKLDSRSDDYTYSSKMFKTSNVKVSTDIFNESIAALFFFYFYVMSYGFLLMSVDVFFLFSGPFCIKKSV